jgi:hypothetical protein
MLGFNSKILMWRHVIISLFNIVVGLFLLIYSIHELGLKFVKHTIVSG